VKIRIIKREDGLLSVSMQRTRREEKQVPGTGAVTKAQLGPAVAKMIREARGEQPTS